MALGLYAPAARRQACVDGTPRDGWPASMVRRVGRVAVRRVRAGDVGFARRGQLASRGHGSPRHIWAGVLPNGSPPTARLPGCRGPGLRGAWARAAHARVARRCGEVVAAIPRPRFEGQAAGYGYMEGSRTLLGRGERG